MNVYLSSVKCMSSLICKLCIAKKQTSKKTEEKFPTVLLKLGKNGKQFKWMLEVC